MKSTLTKAKATVRRSSIAGYGVFADQEYATGDIIEECRVLLLPKTEPPSLIDYTFSWDNEHTAMATGFGPLYNHQDTNNADYYADKDNGLLVIKANRPIKSGEEISLNYGDNWFECRNLVRLKPRFYRSPLFNIIYGAVAALLFAFAIYVLWKF